MVPVEILDQFYDPILQSSNDGFDLHRVSGRHRYQHNLIPARVLK